MTYLWRRDVILRMGGDGMGMHRVTDLSGVAPGRDVIASIYNERFDGYVRVIRMGT